MRRAAAALVVGVLAAGAPAALAAHTRAHHKRHSHRRHQPAASTEPRPGPALLYWKPAVAPQLTNAGVWHARPILVSGATAYRDGEFLYQDFLYDDHGAHEVPDPTDPRARARATCSPSRTAPTPIRPDRATTTTPPTSSSSGSSRWRADRLPGHAEHAREPGADRVLDRDRRPARSGVSVPRRRQRGRAGAAVPDRPRVGIAAGRQLVHAGSDKPVGGPAPTRHASISAAARSPVRFPTATGIPAPHGPPGDGRGPVGCRPRAATCCPGPSRAPPSPAARARTRTRRRSSTSPSGPQEPFPSVTAGAASASPTPPGGATAVRAPALAKGEHLAALCQRRASPSSARGHRQLRGSRGPAPSTGSSQATSQTPRAPTTPTECGLAGAVNPASCVPEYQGQLQPYAIYVPNGAAAGRRVRADAAAALAVGQLQPVPRQPQPVAVRRPRDPLDRDHARGARPGPAATTASAPPTRSRCGPTWRASTSSTPPTPTSPATRWAAIGTFKLGRSSPTCSRAPSRPSARTPTTTCSRRSATCRC